MNLKALKGLLDEYDRVYTKGLEVDTNLVKVVCVVEGKDYEVTYHLSHYDSIIPKITLLLREVVNDND